MSGLLGSSATQWPSSVQQPRAGALAARLLPTMAWAQAIAIAILLGLISAFAAAPAYAQAAVDAAPIQFHDSAEEARFHALVSELRCVMCQNQSLADSNAQIAHDLRREVLDLMRQGKDDAQVKQFLVDRYGEFVLYKPDVAPATYILWFGPLLLLLAGGVWVGRIVARRAKQPGPATDDNDQEW